MMVKVHRKDLLIVQGDWNAIVGNKNDVGRYAVGKFDLGKTNPRGFRLLEFASKHSFTIANTLHPQKIQENLHGIYQTVLYIIRLHSNAATVQI